MLAANVFRQGPVISSGGETTEMAEVHSILNSVLKSAKRGGVAIGLCCDVPLLAPLKPDAFKRCVLNLVSNAARMAHKVEVLAEMTGRYLEMVTESPDRFGMMCSGRSSALIPGATRTRSIQVSALPLRATLRKATVATSLWATVHWAV